MIENPINLGDRCFATFDDFMVILTTEDDDPLEADNAIYLRPHVLEKLIDWWGQVKKEGRVNG